MRNRRSFTKIKSRNISPISVSRTLNINSTNSLSHSSRNSGQATNMDILHLTRLQSKNKSSKYRLKNSRMNSEIPNHTDFSTRNLNQPLPAIKGDMHIEINKTMSDWEKEIGKNNGLGGGSVKNRTNLNNSIRNEFEKLEKIGIQKNKQMVKDGLRNTRKRLIDKRVHDIHG